MNQSLYEAIVCKSEDEAISKLNDYYNAIKENNELDKSSLFESLSLIEELYRAYPFTMCTGYILLNNILLILFRSSLSMCIHCERQLLRDISCYLLHIIDHSSCQPLIQSSLNLLVLFYRSSILTPDERALIKEKCEEVNSDCNCIISTTNGRIDYVKGGMIPLVLSLPFYKVTQSVLVMIMLVSICLIVVYYCYSKHQQMEMDSLLSHLTEVALCEDSHVVSFSSVFSEQNPIASSHLKDISKPTVIQVGDRVYESGKECLDAIYGELEKKAKEEVQAELQKRVKEEDEEKTERKFTLPLSEREQNTIQHIKEIQSQPIPVSTSLRDDLVALQTILEKNGKNPALLEKVKKDIEFFDTVVLNHTVN